ncbi:MAG: patatin-like phospholipase family protein [Clostridia bacterium]|nr:patatin-like phospholipase family protein [Clostridia bacterium]
MIKIGLVLSGGMVKGAYQIGVLKALQEFVKKENISCISTSSVGTIAAYAYVQDRLEDFQDIWLDTEQFNVRTFLRSSVKRSNILDKVTKIVKNHKSIDMDFYTTCLDITKMNLNYINLKNIRDDQIEDYLKASISFVPVYKAIQIDNSKYVDGAVIDNIPVKPLANYDLDYIIVVHFDKDNYIYQTFENKNVIEINFDIPTSISKSLSFDQESSKDMINKGYGEAHRIFSYVFANGIESKEYVVNAINDLKQNCKYEKYNLSGDIFIDRMNIFAKKFVYNDLKQIKSADNNL